MRPRRAALVAAALAAAACRLDAPGAGGSAVPTPVPTRAAVAGLAASGAPAALARLNAVRARAGLAAVAHDDALAAAAAAHADYLRLNVPDRRTTTLDPHAEEPGRPGWSAAGAAAAATADISWRGDLDLAVDAWLGTLYHRLPLLEPRLARVGVASARGATSPIHVMAFAAEGPPAAAAVAHPADGEAGVPIGFAVAGEASDPVPGGWRAGAGYPITLALPAPFTLASAELRDAAEASVPCHVSDPARPATDRPQGRVACLIPRDVLAPATTYRVRAVLDLAGRREERAWAFTTAAPRALDVRDAAAVRAASGELVRVAGTIGAAAAPGYVALALRGAAIPGTSLMVQDAAWPRFAAAGVPAPAALVGRTVTAIGELNVDEDEVRIAVLAPAHLILGPAEP